MIDVNSNALIGQTIKTIEIDNGRLGGGYREIIFRFENGTALIFCGEKDSTLETLEDIRITSVRFRRTTE